VSRGTLALPNIDRHGWPHRRLQDRQATGPVCDFALDHVLDGFSERHLHATDLLCSFGRLITEPQLPGQVKLRR
jgi:hypothetical protein